RFLESNAAVIVCTSGATYANSQDAAAQSPARIDLSAFPGEIVNEVVVPIPAEVFAVLDKMDEPDWSSAIDHDTDHHNHRNRAFMALSFGSLVAEGFIAVQAKRKEDIEKIGRRSLKMADALGLESAVKPHSLVIIDSAKASKWRDVRSELDRTQQTVKERMVTLRDEELSGLVSLGGWLRGTNTLTGLISNSFSVDKAELLNQPDLVSHFRQLLAKQNGTFSKTREAQQMEVGLGRMESILKENPELTVESVEQIEVITRELLQLFYLKPSAPVEEATQ
ncbi:MAG: hypothetical protein AAF226_07920, partial [Verrucomicrobiota bacterium]